MGNACCCCCGPGYWWKGRLVINDTDTRGCGGFASGWGGGGCGGRLTRRRQVQPGDYDSDDDPGCGGRRRRKNKTSTRGRKNAEESDSDPGCGGRRKKSKKSRTGNSPRNYGPSREMDNAYSDSDSDPGCGGRKKKSKKSRTGNSPRNRGPSGEMNNAYSDSDSDPGCGGRRNKKPKNTQKTGKRYQTPRNNGPGGGIDTANSDSDSEPGCGGRKKNKASKKVSKSKKSPTNKVHAMDENPNAQSKNKRNPNGFNVHMDKSTGDTQRNAPRNDPNKGLKDRTNIPNGEPSTNKQTFDNGKWTSEIKHHPVPEDHKTPGVVSGQWKPDTCRYITQENKQENDPQFTGNNNTDSDKWTSRTTHYPQPEGPKSGTSGAYYKPDFGRYITQENQQENELQSTANINNDSDKWTSRTTHYPPPEGPKSGTSGAYYKPDTGRYLTQNQENQGASNNMPHINMTENSLSRITLAKSSFSYNFDNKNGSANETQYDLSKDEVPLKESNLSLSNDVVLSDSKSAIQSTVPSQDIYMYNDEDAYVSKPTIAASGPAQFGKHPSGKHFSPRESIINDNSPKALDTTAQENEALMKKIKELEQALKESQNDLCTQIILDRNMGEEFDTGAVLSDLCHLSNIQKEITVIKHTQIGKSSTHSTTGTNTEGHSGVKTTDMGTSMDHPVTVDISTGNDGIGGTSVGTEIDEDLSETDLQSKHDKEMQAINTEFSRKLRKGVDDLSQKDLKKLLEEHRRQTEKLQLQQQSERDRLRQRLQERLDEQRKRNHKSGDGTSITSSSDSESEKRDNYSDASFSSSDTESSSSSDSESESEENAELMNTVTSEIMTNISSMTEKDMKDYMRIARKQREKLKKIRGNEKQRADESLAAILARRRELTDKEGNVFDGDKDEASGDDRVEDGDENKPTSTNTGDSQTEMLMRDADTQMEEKINKLNEETNKDIDTNVKQMDAKFVQTLMEVQTNTNEENNDSVEKAMKDLLNRHLKQADELREKKEEERNKQKENLMNILKAKKQRLMQKNRKDASSSTNNDTDFEIEVETEAVFKEEVEKDPDVKLAKQELNQELEEMEADLFKEVKFRRLDNNLDEAQLRELMERYRREQQLMKERKEAEMKKHEDNVLQKIKERQKQKEELDKQLYKQIQEKQKTDQLTESDLKSILDQHLKQTSRLEKIQESEKDRQRRKLQEKLNRKKVIDEGNDRKKREKARLEEQAREEAERRKLEEAELKNQKKDVAARVVKDYQETERQLKVSKQIEKDRFEEQLRRKLNQGKKKMSNLPEPENS